MVRAVFFVPLYCSVDVREITRKELAAARFAIRASVIPSEKYSCVGSVERLAIGGTATDRINGFLEMFSRIFPTSNIARTPNTANVPTSGTSHRVVILLGPSLFTVVSSTSEP